MANFSDWFPETLNPPPPPEPVGADTRVLGGEEPYPPGFAPGYVHSTTTMETPPEYAAYQQRLEGTQMPSPWTQLGIAQTQANEPRQLGNFGPRDPYDIAQHRMEYWGDEAKFYHAGYPWTHGPPSAGLDEYYAPRPGEGNLGESPFTSPEWSNRVLSTAREGLPLSALGENAYKSASLEYMGDYNPSVGMHYTNPYFNRVDLSGNATPFAMQHEEGHEIWDKNFGRTQKESAQNHQEFWDDLMRAVESDPRVAQAFSESAFVRRNPEEAKGRGGVVPELDVRKMSPMDVEEFYADMAARLGRYGTNQMPPELRKWYPQYK